jgi:hypothetical protein
MQEHSQYIRDGEDGVDLAEKLSTISSFSMVFLFPPCLLVSTNIQYAAVNICTIVIWVQINTALTFL